MIGGELWRVVRKVISVPNAEEAQGLTRGETGEGGALN